MVSSGITGRLVVVTVAAVSWFAVGCPSNNTVTGPMATATPFPATVTPIPTPTPTPIPLASVHGFVTGKDIAGNTVGIRGAVVTIQNLSSAPTSSAQTSSGEYEIDNLSPGFAFVTVQEGFCPNCCVCHAHYRTSITLSPGLNQYDINLGSYTGP